MHTLIFAVAAYLMLYVITSMYVLCQAAIAGFCGASVEEVSVGFGPVIFSRRIGNTNYRVQCIPTGGSTRFSDHEAGKVVDGDWSTMSKGVQILVMLSGPVSSLVLGLILLSLAAGLPKSDLAVTATPSRDMVVLSPAAVPGLVLTNKTATPASILCLFRDTYFEYVLRLCTFRSLDGWGGWVGWIVTTGTAGANSAGAWCVCVGIICIGNFVFNLIPFPSLIGGRLLLTFVKWLGLSVPEWIEVEGGLICNLLLVLGMCRVLLCDVCWIWSQF